MLKWEKAGLPISMKRFPRTGVIPKVYLCVTLPTQSVRFVRYSEVQVELQDGAPINMALNSPSKGNMSNGAIVTYS